MEQPHVLDRDHGLIGESPAKRDFPVCERPRPTTRVTARHGDGPHGTPFAPHRN
jgi:hypothetical protein